MPVLVSSFQRSIIEQCPPPRDSEIGKFLSSLRGAVDSAAGSVCFVAGVDLAHVGRQFGDDEPLTKQFLENVADEDFGLLDHLAALDHQAFFHAVAKHQDKHRICGFSPLYSLMHLLDATGRPLKYGQAVTAETSSAVTFASLVF